VKRLESENLDRTAVKLPRLVLVPFPMVVQNGTVGVSKPGLRTKAQVQDDSIMGVRMPKMTPYFVLLILSRRIIAA
jgi:hypothetical protein